MTHTSTEQTRQKQLLDKLRDLDSRSVPFFMARKQLLEQGYTEQEIVHGLYSFSYDGKPNVQNSDAAVTKYFAANPAEARRIAKYILEQQDYRDAQAQAYNLLASRYAPGMHAMSRYELEFLDSVGFPSFTMYFSILLAFWVVLAFDLHRLFIVAGPVLVTLYWAIKRYVFHR